MVFLPGNALRSDRGGSRLFWLPTAGVNCFIPFMLIPEGFAVALWTPSPPLRMKECYHVRFSRGLCGRPLDSFASPSDEDELL